MVGTTPEGLQHPESREVVEVTLLLRPQEVESLADLAGLQDLTVGQLVRDLIRAHIREMEMAM
jgi:hypothetical protein